MKEGNVPAADATAGEQVGVTSECQLAFTSFQTATRFSKFSGVNSQARRSP
jgi:hypothetical protein